MGVSQVALHLPSQYLAEVGGKVVEVGGLRLDLLDVDRRVPLYRGTSLIRNRPPPLGPL